MEIRHRKQFLTGKMVAQIEWSDGDRTDADEDDLGVVLRAQNRAERNFAAMSAEISRLQRKIKKMRKERKALVSDLRGYMKAANEYAVENDSLIQQAAKATAPHQDWRLTTDQQWKCFARVYEALRELADAVGNMYLFPPGGETLNRACVAMDAAKVVLNDPAILDYLVDPETIPQRSATVEVEWETPASRENEVESQPIPHHGPGLSEAEDAFKADLPMKGEDDGVTVQYQGKPTRMSFEEAARLQEINDRSAPYLKNDPINPSHYKRGGIECIDVIRAATVGLTGEEAYCTGAALKYLFRWKEKGGHEDLRKARWYLNRILGDV